MKELSNTIQVRVRYNEVDRMGYLHHGNYAVYFEMGRTELIRSFGQSYKEYEDNGIILPVSGLHFQFIKPAKYDEIVSIKTTLKEFKGIRLIFEYEIKDELNEIICIGSSSLIFANAETGKPSRPPEFFTRLINEVSQG